jgi:hypothetical protein
MVVIARPAAISAGILMISFFSTAFAQTDPGVRPGTINGQAGATATNPLPLQSVLTPAAGDPTNARDFFNDGLDRFQEVETVTGNGLGPRFNFNGPRPSSRVRRRLGGSNGPGSRNQRPAKSRHATFGTQRSIKARSHELQRQLTRSGRWGVHPPTTRARRAHQRTLAHQFLERSSRIAHRRKDNLAHARRGPGVGHPPRRRLRGRRLARQHAAKITRGYATNN